MAEETTERLYLAIKSGDIKQVNDIIRDGDVRILESSWSASDPPLVLASKVGHNVEMLCALLRVQPLQPLKSAQECEETLNQIKNQLLSDTRPRWEINARTATGEGALHCVCAHWEPGTLHEALTLLLAAGCDPCMCDNLRRQLPLHLLARRFASNKKSGTPQKCCSTLLTSLQLLTSRCDVNLCDHRKRTCLHVLASSFCTDPKPYLVVLRLGGDVSIQNDRGETPLLEALECGALNAAELLIKESINTNKENSDNNFNKTESKNKINGEINKDKNRIKNNTDDEKLIELQIYEQHDLPPPKVELRIDSLEKVSVVISDEENEKSVSQMRRRAIVCNSTEAQMIKEKSPEIVLKTQNLSLKEGSQFDWLKNSTLYGETALHVAARKDFASIVGLMLQASQDPAFTGARDLNGDTALHLAAGRGHLEVVELLLACEGIDLNARNRKGLTPLHVAVESGFIHVVKLLLESPLCDVAARTADERLQSPFDLAQHEYRRRSQPEMSIILMREAERRKLALR